MITHSLRTSALEKAIASTASAKEKSWKITIYDITITVLIGQAATLHYIT